MLPVKVYTPMNTPNPKLRKPTSMGKPFVVDRLFRSLYEDSARRSEAHKSLCEETLVSSAVARTVSYKRSGRDPTGDTERVLHMSQFSVRLTAKVESACTPSPSDLAVITRSHCLCIPGSCTSPASHRDLTLGTVTVDEVTADEAAPTVKVPPGQLTIAFDEGS